MNESNYGAVECSPECNSANVGNNHCDDSQSGHSNIPRIPPTTMPMTPVSSSSVLPSVLRNRLQKPNTKRPASPFFRPSTPKPVVVTETISTPKGTRTLSITKKTVLRNKSGVTDELENKSSIIGTYANLVNAIVGAGIIGIPYAIRETGLVAGLILIFGVAVLTDKSLRLLIDTGRRANVHSYETLLEAAFGKPGFIFISANMFIMSYGAMLAYLLVLKDTLPIALGVDSENQLGKQTVLLVSSLLVILPLSMQRDIADLSKTSTISVIFDLLMVGIIAVCAPVGDSIEEHGGIERVWEESIVNPSTLFVGLGVLSFAFVCQDSSFIIAGSLDRPTKARWATVTRSSLFTCAILATILGLTGYLGFQDATRGNILNNFTNVPPEELVLNTVPKQLAINVARGLLGLTMFCVYPMASYVARHALIVLLFSGQHAHKGDDHTVLARTDRRIVLTFILYISAIVPAIVWDDTGVVLAITGAVAGSCLSYLGPGAVYLGIYGKEFLAMARWDVSTSVRDMMWLYPVDDVVDIDIDTEIQGGYRDGDAITTVHADSNQYPPKKNLTLVGQLCSLFTWWFFLMPLWCTIAKTGMQNFIIFEKEQLRKKSAVNATTQTGSSNALPDFVSRRQIQKAVSFDGRTDKYSLLERSLLIPPSSLSSATIALERSGENIEISNSSTSSDSQSREDDLMCRDNSQKHDDHPTINDFFFAISYIVLGAVALSAGILSIGAS